MKLDEQIIIGKWNCDFVRDRCIAINKILYGCDWYFQSKEFFDKKIF